MKLLQVTVLCLLTSVGSSEDHQAETSTSTVLRSTISTAKTSGPTPVTMTAPNLVMQSTAGTSPKGITNKEFLQTSPLPALASLITTVKGEEATTNDVKKKELTTKSATVTDLPLPNDVSTLQSSQNKISTSQPDASPSKTSILLSISTATAENISQSQGTESAKNASPSSASSSHSSIILPVVIALIVITLSVFALVGLYRLCRKTDPGTAENGNDQPQSDKESVKLLTVKTISHESGLIFSFYAPEVEREKDLWN
ncbi:endomucin isoform X3 [Eptesicus fuscus]|uniref:endomucin isoform X3 n=1 Tax=Eptesicus fuscus TaxID=29078 RepID=UPI00240478A6|nr:endomucin isoform X3 [Eptesicus fuscus]